MLQLPIRLRALAPMPNSRHSNLQTLSTLKSLGVSISDTTHRKLSEGHRDSVLPHFDGASTTGGTLISIAQSRQLRDGSDANALVADLLRTIGEGRETQPYGMSYARSTMALFATNHPATFTRIIGDLAVEGRTTLPKGQVITWDPATRPIAAGRHVEYLWASLNHLLVGPDLPTNAALNGEAPVAVGGQVANLMTRLTGLNHVNVSPQSLRRVGFTIDSFGGVLAKFGDQASNVVGTHNGVPMSLSFQSHSPVVNTGSLDYLTVPAEVAREESLDVIRYSSPVNEYVHREFPAPPAAPRPANEKTSGPLDANQIASYLSSRQVPIAPSEVGAAWADAGRRRALLENTDAHGTLTAYDHIQRLADYPNPRIDLPLARAMAADLVRTAGVSRPTQYSMRCYARTAHAVFAVHHAAEFSRLVVDLATTGSTTLANGETLHWQWSALPIGDPNMVLDSFWGGLAHSAKAKVMSGALIGNGTYATRGEMANLMSRLTGTRYVNADGRSAIGHLNAIALRHGPLLAEYGSHGGSVAGVSNGHPMSLESGNQTPTARSGLGYVTVPEHELAQLGLTPLQYPDNDEAGYMRWPR